MSNPGDIHLRGEPACMPRAREIFRAALEKFKADPEFAEYVPQLALCQDLAERDFLFTVGIAATRDPEKFAEHFEKEAPDFARLKIATTLLAWNKAGQKRK